MVSLAGKLSIAGPARASGGAKPTTVGEDVTIALVGLGWPERVAAQAVEDALASASEADRAAVPALLRLALTSLGPRS